MKARFSIIATVLVATVASADEPTFDSVQEEFRQKAVSLLTEEGISAQEFQKKISEIANTTFGSHAVLMKKETANRFRRLPVIPESSLAEFAEHKLLDQFPLPPTDDGLLWITFGWEPVRLADVAKKAILARTLTAEQFSRRALVNACCPDKVYRLGEGEYPDLVADSLGDLFVIKVEMTEVGVCKPVSVRWMKKDKS